MTRRNNDEIEILLSIDNSSGDLTRIVLEPWAEQVDLRKGDRIELLAVGPAGNAHIDQMFENGVLVLHARRGWVVAVKINDKAVVTGSSDFPAI